MVRVAMDPKYFPPSDKYSAGISALVIIGLAVMAWVLVVVAIEWVMD